MTVGALSFKATRKTGKQPRANRLLRALRLARRKRVAYARAQVADSMKALARQIARYEALAKAWSVPIPTMDPLPILPTLPSDDWVNFRRGMGDLRPPVKPQAAQIAPPEPA